MVCTTNSAIADKLHNMFIGQSRSPNIPYVWYGFLLVCYSKFVPKTSHFFRYSTSKMPWSWKPG